MRVARGVAMRVADAEAAPRAEAAAEQVARRSAEDGRLAALSPSFRRGRGDARDDAASVEIGAPREEGRAASARR